MRRALALMIFLGILAGYASAQQGCPNPPGTICFFVGTSTLQPAIPPPAGIGVAYSQSFSATGATAYFIASGAATQSGLTLNVGSTASVTGTPTASGNVAWTLGWTTAAGNFLAAVPVSIGSVSTITVAPATANLNNGETQQFSAVATFSNQFTSDVTTLASWTNTGGTGGCTGSTIGASTGLFTAGSTSGTCLPQASFQSTTGTATVIVAGGSSNPISFQTVDPLPNGQIYQAYSASASGTNGALGVGLGVQLLASCSTCTPPYTWTKTAGTLPAGITLSSAGVLSGTPTASGVGGSLTFQIADSAAHSNTITLGSGITVAAASTVTGNLAQSSITANSTTTVSALGTYSDSSTAPIHNGMSGAQTYMVAMNTVNTAVSSLQVTPATATTTGDFAIGIASSYSSSSLCNAVTATITSANETFHAATTAMGMFGAPPPYYNCFQMFYAFNITGAAADAPTCNWTATVGSGCLIRYYHGMPTADPLDQHPTPLKATAQSACTPTAVTTSQANELLELFCGPNSATQITPPNGFGNSSALVQGGVPFGMLSDATVSAIQTSYAPMATFTPATNEVTLFATFNASNPPNGTVTWASATPTCASVAATTGIVTGQSVTVPCTALITPTFYGSGSPTLTGATVTVNPSANPDTAIIVKPSNVTVTNTGTPSNCVTINCQFSAVGNVTGQGYNASWGSSNTGVASINPSSGLAACTSTPGTVTISAAVSGFSSSTPATLNCVSSSVSTITATDCTPAAFNAAWSQLGTGVFTGTVIIQLPTKTCAWTSGLSLSVPSTVTNLTIQGNTTVSCTGTPSQSSYVCTATDNTFIQDNISSNTQLLKISTGGPSTFFRMTGITLAPLNNTVPAKSNGMFQFIGNTVNFRLDHCDIASINNETAGIQWNGQFEGVIDHNVALGGTNQQFNNIFRVYNPLFDTVGNGDGTWMAATQFGSTHFMFVENNYIVGGYEGDCDVAGRQVVRYNTFLNMNSASPAIHSTKDYSFPVRGCRALEFYRNYLTNAQAVGSNVVGGEAASQLNWGNTLGNLGYFRYFVGGLYRNSTLVTGAPTPLPPATSPPTGWGWCGTTVATHFNITGMGASNWDANSNTATGYPCLDGFGRGQQQDAMNGAGAPNRTNLTRNCTPGFGTSGCAAWPHQLLEPIYLWMNTLPGGMSGEVSITDQTGTVNRDLYYDCNSYNSSCSGGFTGAAGTGFGVLSGSQPAGGVARPATCTAGPGGTFGLSPTTFVSGTPSYGVAWWAVDTSTLYVCTSTNTWTAVYSPWTYPHQLNTGP